MFLNTIKEIQDTQLNTILEKMNPITNKDKGIQGEEFVMNLLNSQFPAAIIENISNKSSQSGYAGDIMIIIDNIKIMIEASTVNEFKMKS